MTHAARDAAGRWAGGAGGCSGTGSPEPAAAPEAPAALGEQSCPQKHREEVGLTRGAWEGNRDIPRACRAGLKKAQLELSRGGSYKCPGGKGKSRGFDSGEGCAAIQVHLGGLDKWGDLGVAELGR